MENMVNKNAGKEWTQVRQKNYLIVRSRVIKIIKQNMYWTDRQTVWFL